VFKRLVIIPTYNEIENIEKIILAVLDLPENFDVLVVDDNSPDGTGNKVKEMQQQFSRLHFLSRKEKNGLGRAYIAGFKWAIESKYDFIFEMDADFSHNPKDLSRLSKACETDADMAIGSRYTKGGKVSNWPIGRILMSYFASVYVNIILWMGIADTTAGFVCYKRKVLETISLDNIQFMGYAFQIEMKYEAQQAGFKLKEIPITFIDRKEGVSKMSTGIFKEAFLGVLKMRFQQKKYKSVR
jgi:dolichol-phosphate mannosyltransferase